MIILVNTYLSPISSQVSTGRHSKNGIMIAYKNTDAFKKVVIEPELIGSTGKVDDEKFQFKKSIFTIVEPGLRSFQFSIKRLDKNEKELAIGLNIMGGGH